MFVSWLWLKYSCSRLDRIYCISIQVLFTKRFSFPATTPSRGCLWHCRRVIQDLVMSWSLDSHQSRAHNIHLIDVVVATNFKYSFVRPSHCYSQNIAGYQLTVKRALNILVLVCWSMTSKYCLQTSWILIYLPRWTSSNYRKKINILVPVSARLKFYQ